MAVVVRFRRSRKDSVALSVNARKQPRIGGLPTGTSLSGFTRKVAKSPVELPSTGDLLFWKLFLQCPEDLPTSHRAIRREKFSNLSCHLKISGFLGITCPPVRLEMGMPDGGN